MPFFAISVTQAATDCNAVTEISSAECVSLLELFHSTDGANWKNNGGWNVTHTPCSLYGITCENHGVTQISLYENQLTGTIPNFNLPNLQELYLNSNQLTGMIPNFNTLPDLVLLYLNSNQLTGMIPVSYNTLINLKYLDIRNNPLCKKADYDYSIWPIKQSRLYDETTWQAQLETFPICEPPDPTDSGETVDEIVTVDSTVLRFIGLKESYQIGEIVFRHDRRDFFCYLRL